MTTMTIMMTIMMMTMAVTKIDYDYGIDDYDDYNDDDYGSD